MEAENILSDAPSRQEPQSQQQSQPQPADASGSPPPDLPCWRYELPFLMESLEACQQQLSRVPIQDGDETALPSLGERTTQEYTAGCVSLLATDTATLQQRHQAETSLLALQGSPGYITLLLQCYLRCSATAAAAAALIDGGADAAAHPVVQAAARLKRPGTDDNEEAFAALLLLKSALQSRSHVGSISSRCCSRTFSSSSSSPSSSHSRCILSHA